MDHNLLQKYIAGNATLAEKKLVMDWIKESPEHLREYTAQRKLYDISCWQTTPKEQKPSIWQVIKSRSAWSEIVKIAAIATLVFLTTHYFVPSNSSFEYINNLESIYVPSGQRVELYLSDSTRVWVNSCTTLSFPKTFDKNQRIVKLDGEAFFDVSHNAESPFIVETAKYNIKVLGTEFNVIAYGSEDVWETSLLEGSIEVYKPEAPQKVVALEPNNMLYHENNKLKKKVINRYDHYLWREGLICFNDCSIEEIFKKIQMYYDVKVVVNNISILKNRYSGKFRTSDGVEHVIKVLRLNNKFTYTRDIEANTITIN